MTSPSTYYTSHLNTFKCCLFYTRAHSLFIQWISGVGAQTEKLWVLFSEEIRFYTHIPQSCLILWNFLPPPYSITDIIMYIERFYIPPSGLFSTDAHFHPHPINNDQSLSCPPDLVTSLKGLSLWMYVTDPRYCIYLHSVSSAQGLEQSVAVESSASVSLQNGQVYPITCD